MKKPSLRSNSEWLLVSDAVHAIHTSLGCDQDAAAEILLAFSKGSDVEVIFKGFFVEDFDGGDDQYEPDLDGALSGQDWKALFLSDLAKCQLVWAKNRLIFRSLRIPTSSEPEIRQITTYDNVRLSRVSIKKLLLDDKQRRGPKFGDFWPPLAAELAIYIHDNGLPGQVGTARARAASDIADALARRDVSVSTSQVETLLRAIEDRILKQDRKSA